MAEYLYSSPEESYEDHILRCIDKFEMLYPLFESTIKRVMLNDFDIKKIDIKNHFKKMIIFHDLGKLTQRWQKNLGKNLKLPSHAPIGAAYIWEILPEKIKEPLSFAVAIHHTDRGIIGDNIERPDVQAILDNIINNEGMVIWNESINLDKSLFPEDVRNINVYKLRDMARGMRIWARGCDMLEQHRRRIQSSLSHHILKLCDISSAAERKQYEKKGEIDLFGGWLMVDKIVKYMNNINNRKSNK